DTAQIAEMKKKRVDQGAVGVTGRWMHHHAGRLVDDRDVGVLVEDGERKFLRRRFRRRRGRKVDRYSLAGGDAQRGPAGRAAVERHAPLLDQFRKETA